MRKGKHINNYDFQTGYTETKGDANYHITIYRDNYGNTHKHVRLEDDKRYAINAKYGKNTLEGAIESFTLNLKNLLLGIVDDSKELESLALKIEHSQSKIRDFLKKGNELYTEQLYVDELTKIINEEIADCSSSYHVEELEIRSKLLNIDRIKKNEIVNTILEDEYFAESGINI